IATPAMTSAGALPCASRRRLREASTAARQPTRANVSQAMARGWRLPCATCTAWPSAAAQTAKARAESAESSASGVTLGAAEAARWCHPALPGARLWAPSRFRISRSKGGHHLLPQSGELRFMGQEQVDVRVAEPPPLLGQADKFLAASFQLG